MDAIGRATVERVVSAVVALLVVASVVSALAGRGSLGDLVVTVVVPWWVHIVEFSPQSVVLVLVLIYLLDPGRV